MSFKSLQKYKFLTFRHRKSIYIEGANASNLTAENAPEGMPMAKENRNERKALKINRIYKLRPFPFGSELRIIFLNTPLIKSVNSCIRGKIIT